MAKSTFKHFFDKSAACLRVRTNGQGDISLAVVGPTLASGLVVWIWAGADAWRPAAHDFPSQRKPYVSEDKARLDADRIYPTRAEFDRFLECGVNGYTVTEAEEARFGVGFLPTCWTADGYEPD